MSELPIDAQITFVYTRDLNRSAASTKKSWASSWRSIKGLVASIASWVAKPILASAKAMARLWIILV